jgi:TrmH family RNA methyltransferase
MGSSLPVPLLPLSREKLKNLRSAGSTRIRKRKGVCLVEGERAIGEAGRSGLLDYLVFSEEAAQADTDSIAARFPGIPCFSLDSHSFSELSGVRKGPRVLGAARIPGFGRFQELLKKKDPSILVYLDGLQEPGNVGGIIRTGWAFGIQGVLLGEGTADPFSPKGVRASAGGVFHLPLYHDIVEGDLETLMGTGYAVFLAEAGGDDFGKVDFPRRSVLALGSEGHGFSAGVRESGRTVSVPMAAGVDSLNVVVAGSIILARMVKQVES